MSRFSCVGLDDVKKFGYNKLAISFLCTFFPVIGGTQCMRFIFTARIRRMMEGNVSLCPPFWRGGVPHLRSG